MTYTGIVVFSDSHAECTVETEAEARRWVETESAARPSDFDSGQVLRNHPMRRVVASYSRGEGWIANG